MEKVNKYFFSILFILIITIFFSEYIDYNLLKKKISELKTKEELESKNVNCENIIFKTISQNSDEQDPIEKIIKSHIGKYIKIFLTILDDEIKKFYNFYLHLEKEIYMKLNSVLHEEYRYEEFQLHEIMEEIGKIENLIQDVLDLSNFINMNLTAIRKILKKFDKKFNLHSNPIALYYLRHKLKDQSSNLVYVLQFKIIDESSAIIERLHRVLYDVYKTQRYKISLRDLDIEKMISEPLLKEINIANLSALSGGGDPSLVRKIFEKKFRNIIDQVGIIDESNDLIRSNVEFWHLNSFKAEFDMTRIEEYKNVMVDYIEEEKMLDNLIPQVGSEVKNYTYKNEKIYTGNVWLTLIHTFLFTMNGFIVQPSNPGYLERLGANPFLTGVIIAMTPLAAIISTFIYSNLVNSGYKTSYLISIFCLIFGNFLYSFADFLNSVLFMAIGRIFVGLGGARVVNRRYLIEQIPDQLIMHYSLLYVVMICLGMAAGPGTALVLFSLPEVSYKKLSFNAFTSPGWLLLTLWVAFTGLFFFLFEEHPNIKSDANEVYDDFEKIESVSAGFKSDSESKQRCLKGLKKMNATFNNMNLVEKEIEEIIKEEEEKFSYLSIAFTILSLILFSIRVSLIFLK
jgi:hypothetical protein